MTIRRIAAVGVLTVMLATCGGEQAQSQPPPQHPAQPPPQYPWHNNIVATTFWVGEIMDPSAPDGSQEGTVKLIGGLGDSGLSFACFA